MYQNFLIPKLLQRRVAFVVERESLFKKKKKKKLLPDHQLPEKLIFNFASYESIEKG